MLEIPCLSVSFLCSCIDDILNSRALNQVPGLLILGSLNLPELLAHILLNRVGNLYLINMVNLWFKWLCIYTSGRDVAISFIWRRVSGHLAKVQYCLLAVLSLLKELFGC